MGLRAYHVIYISEACASNMPRTVIRVYATCIEDAARLAPLVIRSTSGCEASRIIAVIDSEVYGVGLSLDGKTLTFRTTGS